MGENNISLTPSAAEKLRAEAARRGISVSKLISELLDIAEAEQNERRRRQLS